MTAGTTTQGTVSNGYYRQRIWSGADGERSNEHAYSYKVKESWLVPVKYRAKAAVIGPWSSASMFTFCPALPQTSVDYTNNLVNAVNAKIWGDLSQSKFNLGVFAGEFHETYRMICMLVSRLAKGASLIKRGRFSRALEVLASEKWRPSMTGTAADTYMMVHFGIMPLLNDVQALYEFMKSNYKVVKRVRRHCKYKESGTKSTLGVVWSYELVSVAEARGYVEMVELSTYDRLNCFDLAGVGWELTKLSWMVDWLLPIGNFLSAVNAANKTQGTRFWLTRSQREMLETPSNKSAYNIVPFDTTAFSKYYAAMNGNSRREYSELPWTFPTIENPLGDNLSRWVTSLAYLRQSVGR